MNGAVEKRMGSFTRSCPFAGSISCAVHVQDSRFDGTFGIQLSAQGAALTEEVLGQADVQLRLGLEPLSSLSSNRIKILDLIEKGQAQLEGKPEPVQRFIEWVDGQ
jgi:hypothetical protein